MTPNHAVAVAETVPPASRCDSNANVAPSELSYRAELETQREKRWRFNKDYNTPGCFSDIVTFEHNKTLPDNPCVNCRMVKNCAAAFADKDHYVQAQKLTCFGSPITNLLDLAPSLCCGCKVRDLCSEIVISLVPSPLGAPPLVSSSLAVPIALDAAAAATIPEKASGGAIGMASVPVETADVVGVASISPAVTASVSTSVAASVTSPYEFPFDDPDLQRIFENMKTTPIETLLETLRQLSYGKLAHSGEYIAYAKVRRMICAIGLVLNHQGKTAPRFRPVRKATTFTTRDAKDLSNDLQVLDLHWLSLHSKVEPEPQWKKLFHGSLDFKVASRFVVQVRSGQNKVTALRITEASQYMLSVIQTKEVAERWNTIRARTDKAVAEMGEIADRPISRLRHADIPARQNDYIALSIARGNSTAAIDILSRIAGKTSSRARMRKRISWFIAHKIPAE